MNNPLQGVSSFAKQQPWLVAGVALVVGILLGWLGIGWGLWPVDFENGNLAQLAPNYQQDYVRLVAAEYALNPDTDRAATRIDQLGPTRLEHRVGHGRQLGGRRGLARDPAAAGAADLRAAEPGDGGDRAAPDDGNVFAQYGTLFIGCTVFILLALLAVGVFYAWSTGMLSGARGGPGTARAGTGRPARHRRPLGHGRPQRPGAPRRASWRRRPSWARRSRPPAARPSRSS